MKTNENQPDLAGLAARVNRAQDNLLRVRPVITNVKRRLAIGAPPVSRGVSRWWTLAILGVAASGVAALVLLTGAPRMRTLDPAPVVARTSTRTFPALGVVLGAGVHQLRDGSRATYAPLAVARLLRDEPGLTVVKQEAGRGHYAVAPVAGRRFEVHALGTQITVRGTAFVVDIGKNEIVVLVETGAVLVERGTAQWALKTGDRWRHAEDQPARLVTAPPAAPPAAPPIAPPISRTSGMERRAEVTANRNAVPNTADGLLAEADRARIEGRIGDARAALQHFVTRFARDARAPVAWFTLARVQGASGRHADAAAAYEKAIAIGERMPLREDAMAAAALAWSRAVRPERARAAASAYLREYPQGAFRSRLQPLVTPSSTTSP